MTMRAVVVGAGYAAEGHTLALRHTGVDVVALCGRDQDVVRRVADRLHVPVASTDWRATLLEIRPDIVCLATPAVLRRDVVAEAVELGAHLFCDKPLAASVAEAEAIVGLVAGTGLRHAYAATRRYDPSVAWLSDLVQGGNIGKVQRAEVHVSARLEAPLPFSWVVRLDQGGGLLNNHFPHLASILERVLGGTIRHASGSARFDLHEAPVMPRIHDYRDLQEQANTMDPSQATEWLRCDVDTAYEAQLALDTPSGEVQVHLTSGTRDAPPCLTLVGEQGALVAHGEISFEVDGHPTPERYRLPDAGGGLADRYAALAQSLVADIENRDHDPYLTFDDGLRYQRFAEAIRGR